jgi:D-glycero-beta-D-manno-heptose 1-phosphate adenylyltransferase
VYFDKIKDSKAAAEQVAAWQVEGLRVVFTNGCFDLLHFGHIHYLNAARQLGDKLVVGLNSGASVSRLKGPSRPVNDDQTRLHVMAALEMVDLVVVFEEDTPLQLISALLPDLLVKGGDYQPEHIVGADLVTARGGQVLVLPFQDGYSSTKLIERMTNDK